MTEVGVIPEDWVVVEIGDLCDIQTGNTPPTADQSNYGNDYLFVSPADLDGGKEISNTIKRLSAKGFQKSRAFPKGSTLFTCIGSTIGKTGLATVKLTSNQQINAIFPSESVTSEYMYYAITNRADAVSEIAGNQAVPIVNKTQFSTTLIPLPPTRTEQTAIATALSDADALLSALDGLVAKKEAFKRGMMEGLLSGEIRLEGFLGAWEETTFDEVVRLRNNRIIPVDSKSSIRIIEMEHINGEEGTINGFTNSESVISHKSNFDPGNVLYGKLRPYLRKFFRPNFSGACSTEIWVFEGRDNCDSLFLFYMVQSEGFNEETSLSVGTKMPRAEWSSVKDWELALPPLPEQRAIATLLSDLDAELAALRARRAKLGLVKGGMMEVLLSGGVRLV
jgi:type I restriction enzyme S subunit